MSSFSLGNGRKEKLVEEDGDSIALWFLIVILTVQVLYFGSMVLDFRKKNDK